MASYAKSLCSDSGGGLGALSGGRRDQSLEEAGGSGWFGCGGGLSVEVGTKEGRWAPWSSVSEVGDVCPADTFSLGPQKPDLSVILQGCHFLCYSGTRPSSLSA